MILPTVFVYYTFFLNLRNSEIQNLKNSEMQIFLKSWDSEFFISKILEF